MSSSFNVKSQLSGNKVRDAGFLVDILESIREVLQSDNELRKNVPLTITSRNQRAKNSYRDLLQYEGPEIETVNELTMNHNLWFKYPAIFWDSQAMPDLSTLDPEAQIRCACILYAEYRSRNGFTTSTSIAETLCNSILLTVDPASVLKAVQKIISLGSYYRNLEAALGAGATLALGTIIPENTWTRVLTKHGERFDAAIAHLKQTPLARMAQQYAGLRMHLVEYQLQRLLPAPENLQAMSTAQTEMLTPYPDLTEALVEPYDLLADPMLEFINFG